MSMKFLGLHNNHDANITYTNGTQVKYIKLERDIQIKHFPSGPRGDRAWWRLDKLLKYCEREHKIPVREIDAFCVNPRCFLLPDTIILPSVKNIHFIDHHYGHALSCWPLVNFNDVKLSFVIDGEGFYRSHMSFFKKEDLVYRATITESDHSFSELLVKFGKALKMNGHRLDFAGKLMALKDSHSANIKQYSFNQDLSTFVTNISNELLIDQTYLLHKYAETNWPKLFGKFAQPNDVVTYSGGTAQNIYINTALKHVFKNIVIPPHCPDDGLSLGYVEYLRRKFDQPPFDVDQFPFWQSDQCPAEEPSIKTIKAVAEYLARGKIVGWYQGHGEIGPRALGNRSILMNPLGSKEALNKVKQREEYRPYGASILSGYEDKYFNGPSDQYMLYEAQHKTQEFGAITHVDNSCRLQTVSDNHIDYHCLLTEFEKLTGIPMLLNTSLNLPGKPIAGHIKDAVKIFVSTPLDVLVIGDSIKTKD